MEIDQQTQQKSILSRTIERTTKTRNGFIKYLKMNEPYDHICKSTIVDNQLHYNLINFVASYRLDSFIFASSSFKKSIISKYDGSVFSYIL